MYLETKDKVLMQLDNVKVVPGIAKDIISSCQIIAAGNKVEMGGADVATKSTWEQDPYQTKRLATLLL